MKQQPLFLKFVNDQCSTEEVVHRFLESCKDEKTEYVLRGLIDSGEFPNIEAFRRDFAGLLEDLIDNGPIPPVKSYLSSYMEPSLIEYGNESATGGTGFEDRWIGIRQENSPWIEGLVCYNLCMYLKGFGGKDLKRCPVCKTFFNHKGPHAVYCSNACKQSPAAQNRKGG
jgi:hypothetical protein